MTIFLTKISILAANISDDLFLVIDQVFRIFTDFPGLYFVQMSCMTLFSQQNHFFYSFHTFAHIRQHYFSKYWGDGCMGRPHLKLWGEPSPSPPRFAPLGARPSKQRHTNAAILYSIRCLAGSQLKWCDLLSCCSLWSPTVKVKHRHDFGDTENFMSPMDHWTRATKTQAFDKRF